MSSMFVVLSTYNGGPYLGPLLESIRRQSHNDWTLLVRDDGSSDQTLRLLGEAAAADRRIALVAGGQRQGAAGSFGLLMKLAYQRGAEYLCFADQDDLWRHDKLQRMLEQMQRLEASGGRPSPRLVYSDLIVVDSQLRTVHPSFLRHSRLCYGEGRPLRTLLGRCFVLGCACMINRPLLEFALPLPDRVASHDWWVALCAASIGHVSYFPQPTLWYRRHDKNTSGPAGFWAGLNPLRHSWSKRWKVGWQSFQRSVEQARALRERLRTRSPEDAGEALDLLDHFCGLFDRPESGWRRVRGLRSMGVPAIDLPRRLLYYLCALKTFPAQTGQGALEPVPTDVALPERIEIHLTKNARPGLAPRPSSSRKAGRNGRGTVR
jgi:rhamnosyltransferase